MKQEHLIGLLAFLGFGGILLMYANRPKSRQEKIDFLNKVASPMGYANWDKFDLDIYYEIVRKVSLGGVATEQEKVTEQNFIGKYGHMANIGIPLTMKNEVLYNHNVKA